MPQVLATRPEARLRQRVRKLYVRLLRPYVSDPLTQQRLKLLWDVWGYGSILKLPRLTLLEALRLIGRFLRVDWHVLHAHKPVEMASICRALLEAEARAGEVVVEAGCWRGGSSAKLSILCKMLGHELWVYDSFEGVEPMSATDRAGQYDFSGEYAAGEHVVRENVTRYGEPHICRLHKGWFSETLARPVDRPVKVAYIDCDLAKGTREALGGTVPSLTPDGWIFSQDSHIAPVWAMLTDPGFWHGFGKPSPTIERLGHHLCSIRFLHPQA
jgi:O-methyltransferase